MRHAWSGNDVASGRARSLFPEQTVAGNTMGTKPPESPVELLAEVSKRSTTKILDPGFVDGDEVI